jgi:(2Fe-2S) ferredoxin
MENIDKFRVVVLVSTGTTSMAVGALNVLEAFKNEVNARGLNDVLVKSVGERGPASHEPFVEIHEQGKPVFVYGPVTPDKVKPIVENHIEKGLPIVDWLIGVYDMHGGVKNDS